MGLAIGTTSIEWVCHPQRPSTWATTLPPASGDPLSSQATGLLHLLGVRVLITAPLIGATTRTTQLLSGTVGASNSSSLLSGPSTQLTTPGTTTQVLPRLLSGVSRAHSGLPGEAPTLPPHSSLSRHSLDHLALQAQLTLLLDSLHSDHSST